MTTTRAAPGSAELQPETPVVAENTAADPWETARPALVGAYVGGLAYWLWRHGAVFDREQVLLWLAGGLIVLSVGRGRVAQVFKDWVPLALVLIAYDYTRGAADTLGMPVQVEALVRTEEALFFGQVPTVELQEAVGGFDRSTPTRWWEVPISLWYVSHFVVPFVIPAVLWWRNRERFVAWIRRFLALTVAGLATYVLVPAAPPWLAARNGVIGTVDRAAARGWAHLDLDIAGHLIDKGQGAVNLVAALPSLHGAYAALVAAFFWSAAGPAWRTVLAVYAVGMGLVLVIAGEHYVVDVLLGWAYVAAVMVLVGRWEERRAS